MMVEHPFDLSRTERAQWVAAFCARRAAAVPPSYRFFPGVVDGQAAYHWLVREFRDNAEFPKRRDNLRETVVDLIRSHGGPASRGDSDQVVGMLLCTARDLDFTEIAADLAEWVRKDVLNATNKYRLHNELVPLRAKVWSLLIAWNQVEPLRIPLRRDLHRVIEWEDGTAQLCFKALAQLDPGEGIRLIPRTLKWPEVYWLSTITSFFESVGPVNLLDARYAGDWSETLGSIFYDLRLEEWTRKPLYQTPFEEIDPNRPNRLSVALESVGIVHSEVPEDPGKNRLELIDNPWHFGLTVDVSRQTNAYPEWCNFDEPAEAKG